MPNDKPTRLDPDERARLLEEARGANESLAADLPVTTTRIGPEHPAASQAVAEAYTPQGPAPTAAPPVTPSGFVPGSGMTGPVTDFVSPVYGPYDTYQIVTTPFGEFGVPAHHRMTFRAEMRYNNKANEWMVAHFPEYEELAQIAS